METVFSKEDGTKSDVNRAVPILDAAGNHLEGPAWAVADDIAGVALGGSRG